MNEQPQVTVRTFLMRLIRSWRASALALFGDLLITFAVVDGIRWLVRDLARHHWAGLIIDCVSVVLPAGWIVLRWHDLRAYALPQRAELIAATSKIGKDEWWLDRDGHKAYAADRNIAGTQIWAIDEDEALAFAAGEDAVLLQEQYVLLTGFVSIIRRVTGGTASGKMVDGQQVFRSESLSFLRRLRAAFRLMFSSRHATLSSVSSAEAQALAASLQAAELLLAGKDDDPPHQESR